MPTQTVGNEEQIAWQQVSTPVNLAAQAVILAQATSEDVEMEPIAGSGLLFAQLAPATSLQVNELEKRRHRSSNLFSRLRRSSPR
ncbi:hypothetical protein [Novosphingobium chloroacetimidivorans]|uniref:hypothetical protein n=1 Tax=Novosphingobium chloroacetimidivorans TaxID=1428314 RepID=UPI001C8848D8|nr:hypothetical protein [Novosphingobium chloroacetimidivorans]